jgi:RNA polymerase sigma-70 factor (ECF subfamily)
MASTAMAYARPTSQGRPSDEWLLVAAGRCDEEALAELYARYGGIAYTLACRILRDRALAEDAVQESFLSLWRSAAGFTPERGSARTWILTLVHRRSVDLLRRGKARQLDSLECAPDVADARAGASIATAHERDRLQTAMRELAVELRAPLELAYYGGLTQREVAEELDEPLGTVKSRTFRGLAQLREVLTRAEATPDPSTS